MGRCYSLDLRVRVAGLLSRPAIPRPGGGPALWR